MPPNCCRGRSIPLSPLQCFPFPCPLLRLGNLSGSHALPNGIPPLNKDFYTNLKAQAWWELRRRFEKTHAR
jgi:hypothetical protein